MSQNVNFMITSAEFMKKHEAVIRAAVAECLGVLLYCVITFGFYLTEYTALGNSVLIGFTHAAIMQATLLASGGHINPAVTAGFCFIQWLSLTPALVYILAQFVGSVGCIPILRLLWRGNSTAAMRAAEPEDYRIEKETPNPDDFPSRPSLFNQWKTIYLKPPTTAAQGFWIEFFVGIMIMFVYCSVHDPGRPSRKLVGSFAVGLAITGGHLLSYNFTGGALNPARIFTIAYCEEDFDKYLIYFLGPTTGCITGAYLYKEMMSPPGTTVPGVHVF